MRQDGEAESPWAAVAGRSHSQPHSCCDVDQADAAAQVAAAAGGGNESYPSLALRAALRESSDWPGGRAHARRSCGPQRKVGDGRAAPPQLSAIGQPAHCIRVDQRRVEWNRQRSHGKQSVTLFMSY